MQAYMQIKTNDRSSCSQVTEWLFYRFCKIMRWIPILVQLQAPPRVFLWKCSKLFRTNIFHVAPLNGCFWIYRQFSKFPLPLFCPTCWRARRGGVLTSSKLEVLVENEDHYIEDLKHSSTIQYNSDRCLAKKTI